MTKLLNLSLGALPLILLTSCHKHPEAGEGAGAGGFSSSSGGAQHGGNGAQAGVTTTPWTAQHDGISCTHPKVEAHCEEGWCEIPPGCFLMGAPEGDPLRVPGYEDLTAVTLTHAFVVQQTEVTQAQWLELVTNNPTGYPEKTYGGSCLKPNCPVDMVSWQEVLAFANLMSKRDGYPECYELVECTGELGEQNFECENVRLTTATTYECKGYRLPTEAEWEYAARAGTTTTFYSGDLGVEFENVTCDVEVPVLEDIAWYCHNSGNKTHPVGQKRANAWGLHDMIGNAGELTSWLEAEPDPAGPLIDPQATLGRFGGEEGFYYWNMKGGAATLRAVYMRTASSSGIGWKERGLLAGFRLVRTK